jgi:hypothetical protein
MIAAYDVSADRLYGHIKKRKDRAHFLEFCRYIRSLHLRRYARWRQSAESRFEPSEGTRPMGRGRFQPARSGSTSGPLTCFDASRDRLTARSALPPGGWTGVSTLQAGPVDRELERACAQGRGFDTRVWCRMLRSCLRRHGLVHRRRCSVRHRGCVLPSVSRMLSLPASFRKSVPRRDCRRSEGSFRDGRDRFGWNADRPATRGVPGVLLPDCYPQIGSSGAFATPVFSQTPQTPVEDRASPYQRRRRARRQGVRTRPEDPADELGKPRPLVRKVCGGGPERPLVRALQRFLRPLMQPWGPS